MPGTLLAHQHRDYLAQRAAVTAGWGTLLVFSTSASPGAPAAACRDGGESNGGLGEGLGEKKARTFASGALRPSQPFKLPALIVQPSSSCPFFIIVPSILIFCTLHREQRIPGFTLLDFYLPLLFHLRRELLQSRVHSRPRFACQQSIISNEGWQIIGPQSCSSRASDS